MGGRCFRDVARDIGNDVVDTLSNGSWARSIDHTGRRCDSSWHIRSISFPSLVEKWKSLEFLIMGRRYRAGTPLQIHLVGRFATQLSSRLCVLETVRFFADAEIFLRLSPNLFLSLIHI